MDVTFSSSPSLDWVIARTSESTPGDAANSTFLSVPASTCVCWAIAKVEIKRKTKRINFISQRPRGILVRVLNTKVGSVFRGQQNIRYKYLIRIVNKKAGILLSPFINPKGLNLRLFILRVVFAEVGYKNGEPSAPCRPNKGQKKATQII